MRYFVLARTVLAATLVALASLIPGPEPIRIDTEPIPPAVQQYETGATINLEVQR